MENFSVYKKPESLPDLKVNLMETSNVHDKPESVPNLNDKLKKELHLKDELKSCRNPKIISRTEIKRNSFEEERELAYKQALLKYFDRFLSSKKDHACNSVEIKSDCSNSTNDEKLSDSKIMQAIPGVKELFSNQHCDCREFKVRYTIDQDFYDHWTNTREMEANKLVNQIKLWRSDRWKGLYNPPDWLISSMFSITLFDEPSNKRKRELLMEAAANLKIARIDSSKLIHEIINEKAFQIVTSKPMKPSFAFEAYFLREALKPVLELRILHRNMVAFNVEEMIKLHKIKDDFILANNKGHEELGKLFKLCEEMANDMAEKINYLTTM